MEGPPELPHVGGVDVTMKDAWHIGTSVDGYELSAQGITVTMLEEYLFHILRRLGSEVHRNVFPIKRQAAQGDAQHSLVLGSAYRGRIGDDATPFLISLFGIVELYASHLSRRFYGKEGMLAVGNDEE